MVPDRQKVWTDGRTDGRNGRTHRRRQNFIPPTSSGDNKDADQTVQAGHLQPWHEISNNVVDVTSKGSDQPAHTHSLIKAFASRLNIL